MKKQKISSFWKFYTKISPWPCLKKKYWTYRLSGQNFLILFCPMEEDIIQTYQLSGNLKFLFLLSYLCHFIACTFFPMILFGRFVRYLSGLFNSPGCLSFERRFNFVNLCSPRLVAQAIPYKRLFECCLLENSYIFSSVFFPISDCILRPMSNLKSIH